MILGHQMIFNLHYQIARWIKIIAFFVPLGIIFLIEVLFEGDVTREMRIAIYWAIKIFTFVMIEFAVNLLRVSKIRITSLMMTLSQMEKVDVFAVSLCFVCSNVMFLLVSITVGVRFQNFPAIIEICYLIAILMLLEISCFCLIRMIYPRVEIRRNVKIRSKAINWFYSLRKSFASRFGSGAKYEFLARGFYEILICSSQIFVMFQAFQYDDYTTSLYYASSIGLNLTLASLFVLKTKDSSWNSKYLIFSIFFKIYYICLFCSREFEKANIEAMSFVRLKLIGASAAALTFEAFCGLIIPSWKMYRDIRNAIESIFGNYRQSMIEDDGIFRKATGVSAGKSSGADENEVKEKLGKDMIISILFAVTGIAFLISFISAVDSQNRFCAAQLDPKIWGNCFPRIIFPYGFQNHEHCSFDSCLSVQADELEIGLLTSKIALLGNVEYMSFQRNHLISLPREIFTLKSLRTFDLKGNPVSKFMNLSSYNLAILPKWFENLNELETLDLSSNSLSSLRNLSFLAKLSKLYLKSAIAVDLPMCTNSESFKSLETLDMSQSKACISPTLLSGCPKLSHLFLREASLSNLMNFPVNLKFLDISSVKINSNCSSNLSTLINSSELEQIMKSQSYIPLQFSPVNQTYIFQFLQK
jgi:hypothetical protein